MKTQSTSDIAPQPDTQVSVRDVFGIAIDMQVPAYSTRTDLVPELDADYLFNPSTTLAILAGFATDRRVLVSGAGCRKTELALSADKSRQSRQSN